MTVSSCLVAMLLLSPAGKYETRYETADGNPIVSSATVRARDVAEIPAMEAGVLTLLAVREGDHVTEGAILAKIDDRRAQAAVKVAGFAQAAALERERQDIEVRYAQAAAAVAKKELEKDLDLIQQNKGYVPESEVERKRLDYERARLQIEKAQADGVLAGFESRTKTAELNAAKMALGFRTVQAPFEGEVVKTQVHQSEWVNPGDAILQLMRFDQLYVEGTLKTMHFDRSEVIGKPVQVEITKARGRKVVVSGRIVHADQVLFGGRYNVRAEVDNEKINGSWLLQPGGRVEMTILIK